MLTSPSFEGLCLFVCLFVFAFSSSPCRLETAASHPAQDQVLFFCFPGLIRRLLGRWCSGYHYTLASKAAVCIGMLASALSSSTVCIEGSSEVYGLDVPSIYCFPPNSYKHVCRSELSMNEFAFEAIP